MSGGQPVERPLPGCGCCEGRHALTPAVIANPPGAAALRYRVGTAATFAATMQAAAAGRPELRRLRTRRGDDPVVALLDAWSCTLDVLAFYTERIANEGYLATATELGSLVELARTVGYERGPGRAASAWLAFTLEDVVGTPRVVPIPTGAKVASLPGPGQLPQNFETLTDVEARPEWNALRARATQPARLVAGATAVNLPGTITDVRAGDMLLFVGAERLASASSVRWQVRKVKAVLPLPDQGVTRVTWDVGLSAAAIDPSAPEVHVLRQRASLFGYNAQDWRSVPEDVRARYRPPASPYIFLKPLGTDQDVEWPGFTTVTAGDDRTVELDAEYPKIATGSWLVLTGPSSTALFRVTSAGPDAVANFGLSAKTTRVGLDAPVPSGFTGGRRATVVLAQSQRLSLAPESLLLPVQGKEIELANPVPPLPPGRTVVVSGRRPRLTIAENPVFAALVAASGALVLLHGGDVVTPTAPLTIIGLVAIGPVVGGAGTGRLVALVTDLVVDTPREPATAPYSPDPPELIELAVVDEPTVTAPHVTALRLVSALKGVYDPASVRIAANVAPASHGETKTEVLGSGDARIPFARFRLSQAPLTYVAAPGPGGVVSTLVVRVDGVRWTEVPSLAGAGPHDEVYTVRAASDGKVTVTFGDGVTGARLPSGSENVVATYRVGTGLAGSLPADQLTLLLTRPLGARSVTNPLPTGLAADPDAPGALRRNAPRIARSLDRVVSLTDYEDFARATAGIAKAHASWQWRDEVRVLHLTVAGEAGQAVDDGARRQLGAALRAAGDPHQPLVVDAATAVPFDVAATIFADLRLSAGGARAAAFAALTGAFGFDARGLSQPVTASEVVGTAQAAPGVLAVTVTALHRSADAPSLENVLLAGRAASDGAAIQPAELLTIRPAGIVLTEVT